MLVGLYAGHQMSLVSQYTVYWLRRIQSVRWGYTLRIDAEKVTDLAGWQFDLTFDPDVLEAVEVSEGDFLKKGGGTTFFQKGTIDNAAGKITGLSAALISKGGVIGTGVLLSVVSLRRQKGTAKWHCTTFNWVPVLVK